MKRATVTALLQLVSAMEAGVEDMQQILDDESLPVGDRNVIERSLAVASTEIQVLSRTFADMLADSSRIED